LTTRQPTPATGAIVPTAEPINESNQNPLATGQQEQASYEQAALEHRLRENGQNLGWLGKFFGSGPNAPTNIAGFVVVACLIGIFATFLKDPNPQTGELQKLLLGVMLTALGYLFGSNSKK
jgi:hypothetical protein